MHKKDIFNKTRVANNHKMVNRASIHAFPSYDLSFPSMRYGTRRQLGDFTVTRFKDKFELKLSHQEVINGSITKNARAAVIINHQELQDVYDKLVLGIKDENAPLIETDAYVLVLLACQLRGKDTYVYLTLTLLEDDGSDKPGAAMYVFTQSTWKEFRLLVKALLANSQA